MTAKLKSLSDLSRERGIATQTLSDVRSRVGVGTMYGRTWLLTPREVKRLLAAIHDGPGQPRKKSGKGANSRL